MSDKNNNIIKDEQLAEVSGGAVLPTDKEWADEQMWKIIERDGSWTDVVEEVFPSLEQYCVNANATNPDHQYNASLSPSEMSDYMIKRFFELGDLYIMNGGRRPKN